MPLHDHFRPPLEYELPWESIHNGMLNGLARRINSHLPAGFRALDTLHFGTQLEIDVAAVELGRRGGAATPAGGGTATLPRAAAPTYAPPAPIGTFPITFADVAELRVYDERRGRTLVAAIELVSPANKDRPAERAAFVGKCLSYLAAGVAVVVLDLVTTRRMNMHNDIIEGLDAPAEAELPGDAALYAAAYRPLQRGEASEIEVWAEPIRLGQPLPTMPLRVVADVFVPVEFDAAYEQACRERRFEP